MAFIRLALFSLFFASIKVVYSQSPSADFNVDNGCINENLRVINNSTNADSYSWDFCVDDFSELREFNDVVAISQISYGTGFTLVEDNGKWFGFALGWYSDKLFRLEFGDSPLNVPAVVDLGDPLNILVFPQNIEVVKQNDSWFGFVTNIDNGAGIILLDFGSSLTNSPTAINLGTFGTTGRIWDSKVVNQGADFILVFAERQTSRIIRVNFRDSFYNSTVGYVYSSTIVGPSAINGLDVVWAGTSWKVVLTSNGTNEIYQIDFDSNLLGTPVVEGAYTAGVDKPYRVSIIKEADDFFVAVSGEIAGDIRIFNYYDFNPTNLPSALPYTSINGIIGLDAFRFEGQSVLLGVGTTSFLKRAIFESDCGVNQAYSSELNPPLISYNISGTKKMELIAKDTVSGAVDLKAFSIEISDDIAPELNFTTQNICANHDVNFISTNPSQDITDYAWSFGDANTSIDPNPAHQYASSGDYKVSLQVTAINGCNNFVEKAISIYDEPTPDFQIPVTNPLCTNQNYLFDNTSTTDAGYPVTWQWKVNSVDQSANEDLNYTFTQPDNQSVTLTVSIPGCSNSVMKTIVSLTEGPLTDFSFVGHCEDDVVSFTNNSSGSIIGYNWNFDDGQNSIDTNPAHNFSDKGVYDVTLTASNLAGCNNTYTKTLAVYSKPAVSFQALQPPFSCSGSPTQFMDLTPNPTDSNLSTWQWNFGDPGSGQNTALVKNPEHVYDNAGDYDVSVTVSTNFLCSSTLQLPVTISQSPIANFSFTPTCDDVAINFTDTSVGTILSWDWQIGSSFYATQNPTHTFTNPLSTNATLNITGSNNCISSISKPIVVPAKLIPDFSFSKNCTEQQTLFTDVTNTTADPVATYDWDFEGLGTSTGSPVNFTFSTTGTKNVTLALTTQTGCEYFVTKQVNIGLPPDANFDASPDTGPPPLAVQFTNASAGATSFAWIFNDSENTTSSETSPVFTFQELGEYEVSLIAYNAVNCSDTINQLILVAPVTGLEADGNFYFRTPYPNPTNENLFLGWTDRQAGSLSIRVLDIFGKLVLASEFSSIAGTNESSIKLNGLQAGVYFLQMRLGKREKMFRVVINPE